MDLASKIGERWRTLRRRVPGADHLAKSLGRYFEDSADRLAAGVTFYGFLCLFPLLLLTGAVVGYVVRGDPERRAELLAHLGDFMPGSLSDRLVRLISEQAGTAGIIGVIGLVIAGLGWIDTLRESLRGVWHQRPHAGSVLVKKAVDLVILVGLGATILVSIAVTGFATSLTSAGLALLGVSGDGWITVVVLRVVAVLLALLTNVAVLAYLLRWLPRTSHPFGRVVRGALTGAVLLEAVKHLGFYYFAFMVGRVSDLYGASLAAAFGLLLWINILARVVLFTAAWTVTAPYRADVAPSGTAPDRSSPAATAMSAAGAEERE